MLTLSYVAICHSMTLVPTFLEPNDQLEESDRFRPISAISVCEEAVGKNMKSKSNPTQRSACYSQSNCGHIPECVSFRSLYSDRERGWSEGVRQVKEMRKTENC